MIIIQEKLLYRVSNDNQLLIKFPGESKYEPVKGEFKIDYRNRLTYQIKESKEWRRRYDVPGKITFEGEWSLSPNYDLVLKLAKKEWQRKSLTLKGAILDAEKDFLSFKIKSRPSEGITRVTYLKLRGVWYSDRLNRITFEVRKREKPDILIFRNAWQLAKNKEIIYIYEKLKIREKHTLTFRGYWELSDKNRLTYIIEKGNKSRFDFRVNLQTPNLYPARGKIKYRIGIGLKKRREEKLIVLAGTWKFSRELGLTFEMDYGKDRIRRLHFSSRLSLKGRDKLIFSLYTRDNQPLGISITFRREELAHKDYEYFLRLKKEGKDATIEFGGKIRF